MRHISRLLGSCSHPDSPEVELHEKAVDKPMQQISIFPMSFLTVNTVAFLVSRNSKEAPEDLLVFSKVIHF